MRVSLAHCSNNSSIFSTLSSLPLESDTPVQHRGPLRPDGVVDHIIELKGTMTNFVDLNFLPFYGHATKMLRDVDRAYHKAKVDGLVETTRSFPRTEEETSSQGIYKTIGAFVEKTSNLGFFNATRLTATEQQSRHSSLIHSRPTAVFTYDWRRSLPELASAFHEFCETTFPGQPVQICAHSLGGLMAFDAMRKYPEKYRPGRVQKC